MTSPVRPFFVLRFQTKPGILQNWGGHRHQSQAESCVILGFWIFSSNKLYVMKWDIDTGVNFVFRSRSELTSGWYNNHSMATLWPYIIMLFYIKLWQKGWEEKKFLITYILCARIDCGIRIRNCGPLIIIFKWRLAIQVKRFSREAIPFKREPLQTFQSQAKNSWKIS